MYQLWLKEDMSRRGARRGKGSIRQRLLDAFSGQVGKKQRMDTPARSALVARIQQLIIRGRDTEQFGRWSAVRMPIMRPVTRYQDGLPPKERRDFHGEHGKIEGWKMSVATVAKEVLPPGHPAWKRLDLLDISHNEVALELGVGLLESMLESLQAGILNPLSSLEGQEAVNADDDTLPLRVLTDIFSKSTLGPYMNYKLEGVEPAALTRILRRLRDHRFLEVLDLSTKDGEGYAPIRLTPSGEQLLRGSDEEAPHQPTVQNITIHGPVGNMVTNPHHSQVHQNQTSHGFSAGDVQLLFASLRAIQVQDFDIEALRNAIRKDAEVTGSNVLGTSVKSWIGEMVVKAGSAAWNCAREKGISLLIDAVNAFFGLVG